MLRLSVELPVHGASFAAVRELALACEVAGFDGVWVPDHLVPLRRGGAPPAECLTLLTAIAALTRLRVGPLVLVLPLRSAPTIALQARTLAELAPGGLVLGIGLGGFTYRRAARALGIAVVPAAERCDRLVESIRTLRESFATKPPRPIPIWIGGRSSAVIRAAAAVADGWNCPFVGELRSRQEELERACAQIGRDLRQIERSVYCIAAVGPTRRAAEQALREAGTMATLFGDARREHLFGSPAAALDRLAELARSGVQEVALHLAGRHATRLRMIDVFASDVIPALRKAAASGPKRGVTQSGRAR
jgi:alkanesulfonate monooxygenase SsuD/methylene tetrahydromethanopterin reductase-like flavin-dependent oxidoreductase (luciferase family)